METEALKSRDISLLDILDAVLDKGVVIRGDIMISISGIDLVYLDLRVLLSSVEKLNDVSPTGRPINPQAMRKKEGLTNR